MSARTLVETIYAHSQWDARAFIRNIADGDGAATAYAVKTPTKRPTNDATRRHVTLAELILIGHYADTGNRIYTRTETPNLAD